MRFIVGQMGRIEDADESACKLLGYSRTEIRAMHGSHLVPPDERPAVAASLDRMRRGEIDQRVGRLVRKDGTVIRVEVSAQCLADDQVALIVRPV
jgi:PAS domain S-box-containing protein